MLTAGISRIPLSLFRGLYVVDWTVSYGASQSSVYRLAFHSIPLLSSSLEDASTTKKRSIQLAKTLTPFGISLVCPQGGFRGAGVFHRIHFHGRELSPFSSKFCTQNHPDETLMHFATFLHQFYLYTSSRRIVFFSLRDTRVACFTNIF